MAEETANKETLFKRIVASYTTSLYKRYILVLIVFMAVVALGVRYVSKLKLKSDFAELLPEKYPSVIHMKETVDRIGGIGNLYIAIESDDVNASKRFAKDLVGSIDKNLPAGTFRYIDYNVKDIKDFFTKNKYLYVDNDDLIEIHKRLKGRLEWEKLKKNPFYISLESDSEKKKEFDINDIVDKYKKRTSDFDRTTDGYYIGENGRLLVIQTRPAGSSTSVDYSKKLMGQITKLADDLGPAKHSPSLKIGFAGNFKTTLDEYDSLRNDILSTIILCVILIALSIVIYYLKVRFIFLLGITILIGTLMTFTVTYFKIGYLNSQTAFLGSIIVGNGINYGIIYFARYLEERRRKKSVLESLIITAQSTMLATFTAALATSASFATLLIAQNRGFSQFGFIGGTGMMVCWATTYTFLPSLLTLTEKILPIVRMEKANPKKAYFFAPFSKLIELSPKYITIAGIVLVVLSIVAIVRFIPDSLEMDFSKLRNKESTRAGVVTMNRRISEIFTMGLNPALILAKNEKQASLICDAVSEREKQLIKGTSFEAMVDKCVSIYSFLPEDQDKKIAELTKIKELLSGKSLNFLNPDQKKELEKFRSQFNLNPIHQKDLPKKILKLFQEDNGTIGLMVYIYPSKKYGSLWNGQNLMKFADLVRELPLKDGETIYSSSSSVIFADMLKAISHDGPLTTIISLLAVMFIIFLTFWNFKAVAFIITNLLTGVIIMGGFIAFFHIKLNYFNFIAIPITFGIGVDYAVNMYQRYRLEGRGSILEVLKTTGGAVTLCSVTTIIGYSTLAIANNQALVSFGLVALIGEFTTLFAALFFLPSVILLIEKRQDSKRAKMSKLQHPRPEKLKELDTF